MQFDENRDITVPTDNPMIHTVSYDEKTEILAVATTSDDLCPTDGSGCVYCGYEYKHRDALSLIAGIDLLARIASLVVSEMH